MRVAEACDKCGAERPAWLGERHVCQGDYVRRVYTGQGWSDVPEPHTAEEYELGYLATGRVYFDFPRDWS